MFGPENTPYEKGEINLFIQFPFDYPFRAPTFKCLSKVLHPVIDLKKQEITKLIMLDESNNNNNVSKKKKDEVYCFAASHKTCHKDWWSPARTFVSLLPYIYTLNAYYSSEIKLINSNFKIK